MREKPQRLIEILEPLIILVPGIQSKIPKIPEPGLIGVI